jgi:ribosomal protein S12 methylthiotransferase accessory factor
VALVKSLEELAHTRKYAAQLMDLTPPVALDIEAGHPAVRTQREHLRAYCPQASLQHAAFLWASEDERPMGSPPSTESDDPATTDSDGAALRAIVAGLAATGLEPVACDLTTPDVADLGLAVMRVVVPGLHPLFMGHQNRALGGRRLAAVPAALRGHAAPPAEADNPYPHPFP